jgi:hypothetical protein
MTCHTLPFLFLRPTLHALYSATPVPSYGPSTQAVGVSTRVAVAHPIVANHFQCAHSQWIYLVTPSIINNLEVKKAKNFESNYFKNQFLGKKEYSPNGE